MTIKCSRTENPYEALRQQMIGAATQMADHACMMILKHHGLIKSGRLLVDESKLNTSYHPIPGGNRVVLTIEGKPIGQYDMVCAHGHGSITQHIVNFSFTPTSDSIGQH